MIYRVNRFLYLGFLNLWRHRLRSTLTVLGIVFGVCSVIAMLAIGEGASYEALEAIEKLGSQNIIIRSVTPPKGESVSSEEARMLEYGLTYKDAKQIRTTVPDVEVVVPSRTIRSNLTHRRKRVDGNVIGVVPWYPLVSNQQILEGRFFTERETDDHRNVCVLSSSLAKRLFPTKSPVGKVVKVKTDYYTVVGVLEGAGLNTNLSGEASDLNLFIPLTAARSRFGDVIFTPRSGTFSIEKVELHQLIVKVKTIEAVIPTADIITTILGKAHKQQDYEVIVPWERLLTAQRTERIFNIVLGSIAAISLLVGGIGIMNIMLASVTERTREIGVRRALGAKKRDIVYQFLTETVILSGSGGVLGLLLGVTIPFLITYFAEMTTIIRMWTLALAFGISLITGIVFGMYPAFRAATMDPIEALRHE